MIYNLPVYKFLTDNFAKTGSEVIKKSCSAQLSMKFFLLLNVKMPKMVGMLTFVSRKKNIIGLSELNKDSCILTRTSI